MNAISLGMHLLAGFFLLGLLGSSVVVAISFVTDLHELFEE